MRFDITVNGRPYEISVAVRELQNEGATSMGMDNKEQQEVLDEIKSLFADLSAELAWLNSHGNNYTKTQADAIDNIHSFISDIYHEQAFHRLW